MFQPPGTSSSRGRTIQGEGNDPLDSDVGRNKYSGDSEQEVNTILLGLSPVPGVKRESTSDESLLAFTNSVPQQAASREVWSSSPSIKLTFVDSPSAPATDGATVTTPRRSMRLASKYTSKAGAKPSEDQVTSVRPEEQNTSQSAISSDKQATFERSEEPSTSWSANPSRKLRSKRPGPNAVQLAGQNATLGGAWDHQSAEASCGKSNPRRSERLKYKRRCGEDGGSSRG